MNDAEEPIRVLLVEDDEDIRALLRMNVDANPSFSLAGEAPDGRHAVELLRLSEPDVVIMDLDMPHIDGLGAIRQIRSVKPEALIVVFSARYDKYDADALMADRANLYVDKAQPVDHLFREIELLVNNNS